MLTGTCQAPHNSGIPPPIMASWSSVAKRFQVASRGVTLERRRRSTEKPEANPKDDSEQVKATSEEARRDASDRAAELLARLRKL